MAQCKLSKGPIQEEHDGEHNRDHLPDEHGITLVEWFAVKGSRQRSCGAMLQFKSQLKNIAEALARLSRKGAGENLIQPGWLVGAVRRQWSGFAEPGLGEWLNLTVREGPAEHAVDPNSYRKPIR
ncbi:hypothetical protein [Microvirga pakistanensis]|uniref:hypothetical protein n=1 Tax=Microvirga pakistanensis TaxID=1682650 RepID=UPI001069F78B|nr:hypothetical protein [Microvirga pakistanensis]